MEPRHWTPEIGILHRECLWGQIKVGVGSGRPPACSDMVLSLREMKCTTKDGEQEVGSFAIAIRGVNL